jgi:SSS family solute:Na+ symporter
MIFAGFLKLLMPLIVVIPGIAALVIVNNGIDAGFIDSMKDPLTGIIKSDRAYPTLLQVLPTGLKGLAFAALTAAIVSSLASMANSTSTIFTMDIYSKYFGKESSEANQVKVGRITAIVAFVIAAIVAPALGQLDQAFQFIQEYTGLFSPGILAVFLAGLFYKRATNKAAIWAVVLSIPIAFYFKIAPKGISDAAIFVTVPFLHQMMITAIISFLIIVVLSYLENNGAVDPKGIEFTPKLFRTGTAFNVGAVIVIIACVILYTVFW